MPASSKHPSSTDERTNEETTDSPSLRQRLHSATGDRDAEAKALADRSGPEVNEDDAKVAVQRHRGEAGQPADVSAPPLTSVAEATDVADAPDGT